MNDTERWNVIGIIQSKEKELEKEIKEIKESGSRDICVLITQSQLEKSLKILQHLELDIGNYFVKSKKIGG
jgi:hypothetical protein